jgi:hypothetical protein
MSREWVPCLFSFSLVNIGSPAKNSKPTYPTVLVCACQEAQVAVALRTLLDNNGFSVEKIIGCALFPVLFAPLNPFILGESSALIDMNTIVRITAPVLFITLLYRLYGT